MKSHLHHRRRGPEKRTGAASAPRDGHAADGSGKAEEDPSSRPEHQATAARRRTIAEYLFSLDAKKQFAALKVLATTTGITRRQYHRIEEVRRTTSHLVIAELAERLLRDKASPDGISTATRREVMSLLQESEEHQRRRLLQSSHKPPEITLARTLLVRWLACAIVIGFVLGGLLVCLFLSRGVVHAVSEADTAYIDTRTGRLASLGSESEKAASRRGGAESPYQPAYYCWKCRQWLPLAVPKKGGDSATGPAQALSDRPAGGNHPTTASARRHP